jgi:Ice-binding-like/Secretion system C-terminal sorting domain
MMMLSLNNFAQGPNLGTSANFVLFTSVGAITNTGTSHLTGHVGSNSGSGTGFGNVDGVMNDSNGVSAQASADLAIAYGQLNDAIPNYFIAPLLGNGQVLNAGIYSLPSVSSLNLNLTLDAQNNPNAVFIFQIQGAFSTTAFSEVVLVNGAKACNVFWKIEGMVNMATGTIMKGTIIANNAAILMNPDVNLEGRAMTTTGAISINGITSAKPIGCGSPILNGPIAPNLNSAICYTIFSSNGSVANSGTTTVTGDVGSNVGLTTGFNELDVTGTIHPIPDTSTAAAAADLLNAYNYINTIPFDIPLLYPAQFGNDLVLTPHTYLLNAATSLTGNLYLNAQDNADAVFVIQINGALSTSTYAKVFLINGTKAKNVYWKVDGAVLINDYSEFKGTIICNNGAVQLTSGVQLNGRAMTTNGALSTASITAIMTPGCTSLGVNDYGQIEQIAKFYPNPFNTYFNVTLKDNLNLNTTKLLIYDVSGRIIKTINLNTLDTQVEVRELASGFYHYTIISSEKKVQSGTLIAK